jgi:hypothetical protein
MIDTAAKIIAALGFTLALAATPGVAQDGMSAPLTPHPLDQNRDDKVAFALFSFGADITDHILDADKAAADALQVAEDESEAEVFVALVPDWERAALMGAGLFGNGAIVDHFDALVGTNMLVDVHLFEKHLDRGPIQMAVVLTEVGGRPVAVQCVAQVVVGALYTWSKTPMDTVPACIGVDE